VKIDNSHKENIVMPSRRIAFLICSLIALAPVIFCQESKRAIISGTIHDETGAPLPMVNVQLEGTNDGDASDLSGRFEFAAQMRGEGVLRASLVGYDPVTVVVDRLMGDSVILSIEMREALVKMDEVVVSASAYTIGDDPKALSIRSLDVVTTPGASADVLHAIQTLPGVSSVDEGAGLFVRGGDVSETSFLLDQATVVHPYKFESPTGGYFGTIPPFLLGGTFFSSGGFSARYGNTLSGVLAMESMGMPTVLTTSIGVGLAAACVGAGIPIVPDVLGLRISGNKSFTDAMFRMNVSRTHFTVPPDGFDANACLVYKYSSEGQLKLLSYVDNNRVGARADQPSFAGVYDSREASRLHNLQWVTSSKSWLMKGSFSSSQFAAEQELGILHLKSSDIMYKARFDLEEQLDETYRLFLGTECEKTVNRFEGTVPRNPAVLDPGASAYLLDEEYAAVRVGAYAELEAPLIRRVTAMAGVRSDYNILERGIVVDPRISLRYDISKELNARFAWGVYHQFPQPYLYNDESGNPLLGPQQSTHLIAGAEYSTELLLCRVEAYRKSYANLVLRSAPSHYMNGGDGVASGIDFFMKYGGFLRTPVSGWVSYSHLTSRRLQARDLVQAMAYEHAPTSFDITHNLTIVCKAQLISLLSIGFTFRYATGVPVTPITGAIRSTDAGYFEPIEGPVNSERMPDFIRLDATLSYFQPFGESNAAIFYVAVTNLLNRPNPVGYEYSRDYTERRLRTTDYRRFIYFGVSISFGTINAGD
jgi:vitamin B12 transporter